MPKKASSLNLVIANTLKVLAKLGWRKLVESRLRRQAWLLNKLGRTEHCRLALAVATGLDKESGIPLEKQPFLRGMVVKSLFEMSSVLRDYTESLPALAGDRLVAEEGGRRNKSVTKLYRIKVSLQSMRGIWRIIEIKGNQTLHTLHKAIFSAFDRFDEHLYAFYLSNKAYDEASGYESPYSDERTGRDASHASIDSLGLRLGQRFLYIFDFGDNWQHTVEVLGIREEAPKGKYPRLIEKKGDSPPQYPDAEEDENS